MAKRKAPLPDNIRNAPEVSDFLKPHWSCFWDLRRGLGKWDLIPWRDVQLWCDSHGIEYNLTQEIHTVVRHLSQEWALLHPKPKGQQ